MGLIWMWGLLYRFPVSDFLNTTIGILHIVLKELSAKHSALSWHMVYFSLCSELTLKLNLEI